jgi:signal transduction histidine kinase
VAWLGFRLIEQDRALEKQRLAESRELAAGEAVRRLTALVSDPALLARNPEEGALLARFPNPRLLFRRTVQASPEAADTAFREGEALEFGQNDPIAAAAIYARQARDRNPAILSGALYRLGRSLHKAGRTGEALEAYGRLARMDNASAGGWPAPVSALWSRCRILETAGRLDELRREATRLRDLLISGRHPMSRASYASFADDAARWSGRPRPHELERLTDAILSIESGVSDGSRPPVGRTMLRIDAQPVTVVWGPSGGTIAVFAAGREFVERQWLSQAGPGVWLRDDHGADLGRASPGAAAIRYAAETQLPWNVVAAPLASSGELDARRRLLMILLAAVGLFTLTGAYFVFRALQREFALARMQEDFVAAVSHEFRTPLTTLRQITESLEDGRVNSEDKRSSYYRSLSRATQRLHRLVEDVLDFRRMQSGAMDYRRACINTREFTARIAADFQHEVEDRGFTVAAAPGPEATVMGDREALSRALWNLLDNAVKYSGEARSVELSTELRGNRVEWRVRDQGIGIPAAERRLVFQRFFRGDAARSAGIRGTGIGLAMVQQIAAAHGGSVSVESEPGAGSVFTLSIPCEEAVCSES